MKIAFLHASLAFSAAAPVASVPAFAQSAPQTVLIGLAAPLTGPSARIGKDLQNGAQLAIDDANAKHPTIGGKPVVYKLVAADDQSDPRTAVAVAQQLVDQHVIGVVGHWNTGCSVPASRVYRDAGIPQIAPASTGHQYTQQGYTTAFRIMGHDDAGGNFTGAYAVKTLKAKRIAVIDDRTSFGSGRRPVHQGRGGERRRDRRSPVRERQDDRLQRRADRDQGQARGSRVLRRPRCAGRADLAPDAPARRERAAARRGRLREPDLPVAGRQGRRRRDRVEPGLPLDRMPGGKAFDTQYQTRFRAPIELHAPFAYDAAATLIAAAQKAGTTQPAKLVAAVRAIDRPGVTGRIAFDNEGNLKDPAFTIYQARGGKWTVVDVLGGSRTATK